MSRARVVSLLVLSLVALPLAAQSPTDVPTRADTVRGFLAAVRSDLRNLVTAQEAYYADHARYGTSLEAIKFIPSRGVTLAFTVTEPNGWAARATVAALRGSCVIWVGLEKEKRPRTAADSIVPNEGTPRCDAQPEFPAAAAPTRPEAAAAPARPEAAAAPARP
jgi:hypothetical protein